MNISKSSWHYKAIDKFGTGGSKVKFYHGCHTTCSYIRALIWACIMAAIFGVFVTAMSGLAAGVLLSMIAAPIQLIAGVVFVKATWTGAAYVFGTFGWMIVGCFGLVAIVAKLIDLWHSRRPSAAERANLIKQAYQDKKDGICTLVNVTE